MKRATHVIIASVVVGLLCSVASAYTSGPYNGSVSFTSDLQPVDTIDLPSFDTSLGTLTGVEIKLWHSGSVSIQGDNDDDLKTADVKARMIRSWTLTGPDLSANDNITISSDTITLAVDDGDDSVFDASPDDGYNFGSLIYTDDSAGTYYPSQISLYETVGPGTISLSVDPTSMVNDLNWVGMAPDQYQTEVQNPLLTVKAQVIYTYVPEPTTAMLVLLSAAGFARRRRR